MKFFVNATAAEVGGLYTIVDQFLASICKYDAANQYYIFVSTDGFDKYESKNVKIIKVNAKKWIRRFMWDTHGMQMWAKNNKIFPDKIISLQNTPVRFFKEIQQLIYLHTPIPFVPYSWDVKNKNERKMWFYKNVYPLFIKLFLHRNCEIVVQANWLKESVSNFLNMPKEKIHVIRPNVNIDMNRNTDLKKGSNKKEKRYFYPAIDYIYKNHITILNALVHIKEYEYHIYEKLKIAFTVDKESWIYSEACKLNVDDAITFLGRVDFDEILKQYASSDMVLFPSYIETFGLPLIEAASFQKNIICANEEYAKEVLKEYEGVKYVNSKDVEGWRNAILESFNQDQNSYRFRYNSEEDTWGELFGLICERKGNEK